MPQRARFVSTGLLDTFQGINKPLWDEIFTKKSLDGDTEKKLIDAITKFKSAFTAK